MHPYVNFQKVPSVNTLFTYQPLSLQTQLHDFERVKLHKSASVASSNPGIVPFCNHRIILPK